MGETVQREVQTSFTAVDHSSATLGKIASSTARVEGVFNNLSRSLAGFAGLAAAGAGAFSAASVIRGTYEHIGNVKRIVALTGEAAERADGLVEAFARVGIEGEEAGNIMLRLSRSGAKMEMALAGAGAQAATLSGWLRTVGVDVSHGPVRSMIDLSGAMKRGKVDLNDLMLRFRLPPSAAIDMARFLKQGPERIKATVDEIARSGLAVTPETLRSYGEIKEITHGISTTWNRIMVVVGSKLLPVISELLEDGEHKLEGWLTHAVDFGETMGRYLRDHLSTVTKIGKVLLLNSALVNATGSGLIGNVTKGLKWSFPGGKMVVPQAAMQVGVGGIYGAQGLVRRSVFEGGGAASLGFSVIASKAGIFQRIATWLSQIASRFAPMLTGIARISGVLTLVAMVADSFSAVRENLLGIGDYLSDLWGKLKATFTVIAKAIDPVIKPFTHRGVVGQFFALVLPLAMGGVLTVVQKISEYVMKIGSFLSEVITSPATALRHPIETWKRVSADVDQRIQAEIDAERRRDAATKAKKATDRETPDQRDKKYFDFRGSRFDIKQNFGDADPDRIAVAFAHNVASLGERRMQSAFAPLFSIRTAG